ncbi:MAG: type II toxin-antitoxin system VapC family toxin [Acidobacteria bacterium]|nr:type II toxin-antitoxin system VapC family toxin [Acidobacteriota bacterium]MYD72197.1 type II toxin-antitoxin system VapC family toxin [Acidobacteriota bacterium]MYJ04045.1 type II toxin-antitoxin system VapC family toxin [Acidobacteriota bacterium]
MVTCFVLDASVAAAWLFDDEDNPRANAALERLETELALVPQLWHLEVRSALIGAERRGRMRADEVDECLRRIEELPVETDTKLNVGVSFALARAHRLSIYDATYLELALRADAPLATLDKTQAAAAVAEGRMLVEALDGLV